MLVGSIVWAVMQSLGEMLVSASALNFAKKERTSRRRADLLLFTLQCFAFVFLPLLRLCIAELEY